MGNYQDTKRRFQKNNRSNNEGRPSNYKTSLPVFFVEDYGSFIPNGTRFDIESLDSILASLNDANAFRLVSHSIYMKKSDVFADAENARGNIAVGYIRNITQNGDIAITINSKYVEAFKRIQEPTIQVNGIVKNDQINTILSFNIGNYSTLYDMYIVEESEDSDEDTDEDTTDNREIADDIFDK